MVRTHVGHGTALPTFLTKTPQSVTRHLPTSTAINRWFLWAFVLWVIVGGILWAVFDRREIFERINSVHTSWADNFLNAYTALGDGTAIYLILLTLFGAPAFRNLWFALTAAACNLIPALVVQLLKALVAAPRPLRYWEQDNAWIHLADGWRRLEGHHSFPSGHTAGAFSLACFLSILLPKRFAPLGLLIFFMALGVGYSRLYLAAHFYADVYVGSIVGTLVTLLVYAAMRAVQPRFYDRNAPDTTLDDDHDDEVR